MNEQTLIADVLDAPLVCPVCKVKKPEQSGDLHDIVIPRMDWRKADRPDRTTLSVPVGDSPMCFECYKRIRDEHAPKAPSFDDDGKRIGATATTTQPPKPEPRDRFGLRVRNQ